MLNFSPVFFFLYKEYKTVNIPEEVAGKGYKLPQSRSPFCVSVVSYISYETLH